MRIKNKDMLEAHLKYEFKDIYEFINNYNYKHSYEKLAELEVLLLRRIKNLNYSLDINKDDLDLLRYLQDKIKGIDHPLDNCGKWCPECTMTSISFYDYVWKIESMINEPKKWQESFKRCEHY